MALYPDNSVDERSAFDAARCESCGNGGAWMYCAYCESRLCSSCRNKHHELVPEHHRCERCKCLIRHCDDNCDCVNGEPCCEACNQAAMIDYLKGRS